MAKSLLQTKLDVKKLIEDGTSTDDILSYISKSGFTEQQIKNFKLDEQSGASFFDRFVMGLAPNKKSRDLTMSKKFPESVKVGNNYAIYDDSIGGAKMFNPSGFDFGDVAEFGGRGAIAIAPNIFGAYQGQKIGSPFGGYGKVAGGVVGAGLGETVGGVSADQVFKAFGGEIDRTVPEYLSARGFDFTLGSVSEFITPYILKQIKKPFAGFTKKTREKSAQNIKNFEEANVSPSSLSVLSEGQNFGLVRDLEYILGNIPIAKEKISKAGLQIQKDMGESLIRTSNYLVDSPALVNNITLNNITKNGIESGVTKFKTKSTALYNESFDLVKLSGDDFAVNVPSFVSILDEIAKPKGANITKVVTKKMAKEDPSLKVGETIVVGKKGSVLQSPKLIKLRQEILDKIEDGTLTFKELRNYRSLIGSALTNANLADDISKAEYKRLYGALSEDLKVFLKDTDKAAYTKFLRADNYYKASQKRINDILQPILNKVDQDRIINFLFKESQEGSKYINGLKKSLKPEEFAYIQNAIIQKLGKIKPSEGMNYDAASAAELFNSNTFLTNWNKIDPKAKDFLFSSKKYADLRKDLDRLAVISADIAEAGKTFENPSKTAGSMVGQLSYATAVVGGSVIGLMNVFKTGLFLVGGAELVTNPKIVKWLVQGTDIANNEGVDGVIKHFGKVGTVFAGSSPEVQEWVAAYGETLANQKKENKDK
jgi:hypothetical protein